MIIEIENTLPELVRLQHAAEEFLGAAGVDDTVRFAVLLALEEIVSNIIRYAYDDQRAHTIHLDFHRTPQSIDVEVTDDGRAFNPCAQAPVDTRLAPEERSIGGLGIFLTREMAQEMHYRRGSGTNHLTLRFSLSAGAAAPAR